MDEQILKGLRLVYAQNQEILKLLKSMPMGEQGVPLKDLGPIDRMKQAANDATIEQLAKDFGGTVVN